jgi:uncharacterized membrane protein YczE
MSEKYRRVIMTLLGVFITGFSVGMFNFSAFGMDPFQVLARGIWTHLPLGYGMFYSILNLLMLIFIFFIDRRKIGLGTVISVFLSGYVIQYSSWLFEVWIPNPSIGIKLIFLIIGIIVMEPHYILLVI